MSDNTINIRGVSAFYYWAIPLILGLAAAIWLGVYIHAHYFVQDLSQEKRHADFVGAAVLPNKPIEIGIVNQDKNNVIVERGDVLGKKVTFYFRNTGRDWVNDICFTIREKSPDGTVIGTVTLRAENSSLGPNERGEQADVEISDDPRISRIEIGMWCE